MNETRGGRDDAAMADILASIRRIVHEEERTTRASKPSEARSDVLVLTGTMRTDLPQGEDRPAAPEETRREPLEQAAPDAREPEAAPPAEDFTVAAPASGEPQGGEVEPPEPSSLDEAQVADIARAVLHEELKGEFGKILTRNMRLLVREEVQRVLNERRQTAT